MSTPITSTTKSTPSSDDLSAQIEALRADLKKLFATLSDDVSDSVGKARQQIGHAGQDARATATSAVLEHPLTAVGIAAGVGFLLGMFTRKA